MRIILPLKKIQKHTCINRGRVLRASLSGALILSAMIEIQIQWYVVWYQHW